MKRENFGNDWLYHKDGQAEKVSVMLPHDAMIHDERSPESPGRDPLGYFVGGLYIYEKEFFVPVEWQNQHIELAFGGVYRNTTVYINDQKAGGRPYGYIPFTIDCDAFLKYGETNTIRVEADNSQLPNSRWYSGGGIYRNVYLLSGGKDYIKHEGVKITTTSLAPATISVCSQVMGEGDVMVEILDKGQVIASAKGADVSIVLDDVTLWSEECPYLYTYRVTLQKEGQVCDVEEGSFGIRQVSWDTKGLYVNGKSINLRGACIHHDNGVVGGATFAKAEERRIRILKENGYNAIRMSHHPASYELLEACDKYGVYVMDETFDMWYQKKNAADYSLDFEEWFLKDTQAMIEKDYNHPSVIMYSIGNEVSEPATEKGVAVGQQMIDLCHQLDPSRAVTGGINLMIISMAAKGKGLYDEGGAAAKAASGEGKKQKKEKDSKSGSLFFNMMMTMMGSGMTKAANSDKADKATTPILDALDIAGYNYASGRYPMEGKKHPNRIVVGSETFPQDIYKNWKMVEELPYLIGDFMWTGWDYLGEAAIGTWNYEGVSIVNVSYPWLISGSGAIDILGRVGAEAAYAAIVWDQRKEAYLGVRPVNHPGVRVTKSTWRGTDAFASWAWKNCDGNTAEVEVYGRGAYAELYLNGHKMGKKKLKEYKAMFKIKYTPGTLEAVIYNEAGTEISRTMLESATGKSQLTVRPEEQEIAVGDVVFVPVEIRGANDVIESNDDKTITLSVEHGVLEGFGSAKPFTEERFDSGVYTTYYGQTMAVIRATQAGTIKVTATAEGMEAASAEILVK